MTRQALGQAVARIDVTGLDGRPIVLADLRGRVVLLDVWATWCAPCLAELPRLQRARAAYGERLAVIGISVDVVERASFVSWLRRHRVDWPQVFDGRGWSSPLLATLGVEAIPFSLLLDVDGRVVGVNVTGERLDRSLEALLGR